MKRVQATYEAEPEYMQDSFGTMEELITEIAKAQYKGLTAESKKVE